MLHIKKTGTQFEAEGKKHTKDFIDSCWNDANHKYENLIYDSSRLENLGSVLFEEQKDKNGNSFCCYCMRRLFLNDTEDKHKKNITYEHIVPLYSSSLLIHTFCTLRYIFPSAPYQI